MAFIENVKQFIGQAEEVVSQVAHQQRLSLKDCQDFFLGAEWLIKPIQPAAPEKEFQEFCKNASQSLLKEYRQWMELIKKNDKGGLQKINLLKIFGISAREEPHSRFLVWLMKEEESHGLGNVFLQRFLDTAADKCRRPRDLSSEGVVIIPEAAGERGIPDIKIKGPDFLCVVENKIMAAEGKDQTERYARDAHENIQDMKISEDRLFLIFLTPTGRAALSKEFVAMSYPEIISLLREILQAQTKVSDSTEFLIQQFISNLEMEILHVFDFEKRIESCVAEYSRRGDKYLWEDHENIYDIYNGLMQKEN